MVPRAACAIVRLNGDEVARVVGESISAIVAMVGDRLPEIGDEPSALASFDAMHEEQHRATLGRMPARPSERRKGVRYMMLALTVDERTLGVGFREGDELSFELQEADSTDHLPGRDRDAIEPGP